MAYLLKKIVHKGIDRDVLSQQTYSNRSAENSYD